MRDRGRAKEETPSVDTVAVYRIEGMTFEWHGVPARSVYAPM